MLNQNWLFHKVEERLEGDFDDSLAYVVTDVANVSPAGELALQRGDN